MIRKEVLFVFVVFLIINLCYNVIAVIGVTPASYEVDFEPNLEKNFNFNFIFDPDSKSELYAEGDLSNYTKLDKSSLTGGGSVSATLKLPPYVEIPGTHIIFIGARQLSNEEGMGIVGNVRGLIKVKVPYPGKYAEIVFTTMNVNAGNPVDFKIIVNNLGKENITASASIVIYNPRGEHVETLTLENKFIEAKNSEEFFVRLNTSNYKAGDYKAVAFVNYDGKTAEAEAVFRLGELYVGITNYTKEFERNKINKLEIEIESFWNDPIESIYASVNIINYTLDFLTPSMQLSAWSKTTLTGFFDTTLIKEEKFQANITLHYKGKTTNKIVELEFKKEINYIYIAIGVAVLLLVVLILIIIVLLRRRKSGKKEKKHSIKK